MRASHLVGLAGVVALLLVGLLALLTISEPETPACAPPSDPTGPLPVAAESRAVGLRTSPITPVPFDARAEEETDARASAEEVIAGEVLDFNQNPAPNAEVAIFELKEGAPVEPPFVRALTDDRGKFRLPIPRSASTDCVLVAFKARRRPATLAMPLVAGARKPEVRLMLGEGATIEGIVHRDGSPAQSAIVTSDIRYGVAGPYSGETELWWQEGAFETKRAIALCDGSGRFVLTGLARATYLIQVNDVAPPEHSIIGDRSKEVSAPASGVELGVETGLIVIRVQGNGQILAGVQLAIRDPNGGGLRSVVSEPTTVRVRTAVPYIIEAACHGFLPREIPVPALLQGETRKIDLDLSVSDEPEIRLTLHGATAMSLRAVGVRLFPISPISDNASSVTRELRQQLKANWVRDEEFLVARVPYPSGRYIVVVLPDGPDSWVVPAESEIELPHHGSVATSLDVIAGGRLRASLLDVNGAPVTGRWLLRDSRGIEVLSRTVVGFASLNIGATIPGFVRGQPQGGSAPMLEVSALSRAEIEAKARGKAEAGSLRREADVLPPGRYEIEATADGYRSVRRQVVINPNSTTTEEVRLEREGPDAASPR